MKKAEKKDSAQIRELTTSELKNINGGTAICVIIDGKKYYIEL